MIHTVENIKPHPLLRRYIVDYTIRKINFEEGEMLSKIMPQRTINSLEFFLSAPHKKFDYQTGQELDFKRSTARGLRTYTKYKIQFESDFTSLTVKFTKTGMYSLLGIPMKYFTNEDLGLEELNIFRTDEILEKLMDAGNDNQYVPILEKYLLQLLKQNKHHSRLSGLHISSNQFTNDHELQVHEIARKNNLSIRQIERIFLEEIGISLKKLNQLHKFDFLIKDKIAHPEKSWTELTYKYGFYDQSDLYRTFKTYLDTTPSRFDASQFAF